MRKAVFVCRLLYIFISVFTVEHVAFSTQYIKPLLRRCPEPYHLTKDAALPVIVRTSGTRGKGISLTTGKVSILR